MEEAGAAGGGVGGGDGEGPNWPFPASFDGYAKEWVDGLMEECAKHFYELGLKAKEENK